MNCPLNQEACEMVWGHFGSLFARFFVLELKAFRGSVVLQKCRSNNVNCPTLHIPENVVGECSILEAFMPRAPTANYEKLCPQVCQIPTPDEEHMTNKTMKQITAKHCWQYLVQIQNQFGQPFLALTLQMEF